MTSDENDMKAVHGKVLKYIKGYKTRKAGMEDKGKKHKYEKHRYQRAKGLVQNNINKGDKKKRKKRKQTSINKLIPCLIGKRARERMRNKERLFLTDNCLLVW